jgi:hypothetical protein
MMLITRLRVNIYLDQSRIREKCKGVVLVDKEVAVV